MARVVAADVLVCPSELADQEVRSHDGNNPSNPPHPSISRIFCSVISYATGTTCR
jgi:hypothetical protein